MALTKYKLVSEPGFHDYLGMIKFVHGFCEVDDTDIVVQRSFNQFAAIGYKIEKVVDEDQHKTIEELIAGGKKITPVIDDPIKTELPSKENQGENKVEKDQSKHDGEGRGTNFRKDDSVSKTNRKRNSNRGRSKKQGRKF